MIMEFIEYNNFNITIAIQDTSKPLKYDTKKEHMHMKSDKNDDSIELMPTTDKDLITLLDKIVNRYDSKCYLDGFYVESNNKLEMLSKSFSSSNAVSNNPAKRAKSFNSLYVKSNNKLEMLSKSFNSLHLVNPPDLITQLRFGEVIKSFTEVRNNYKKFTDNVNYISVDAKLNDTHPKIIELLKDLIKVYNTAKTITISLDTRFRLPDAQEFTAEKDVFVFLENNEIMLKAKLPLNSEDENSNSEALQLIEDENSHREALELNEYKNFHREALQLNEYKNSNREALELNEYKNSNSEALQLIEDESSNSEASQLIDELTDDDLSITEDASGLMDEVIDCCCIAAWNPPCAII